MNRTLASFLLAATPLALAQSSAPLPGAYGFQLAAYQVDSAGSNGGAIAGILNFDGAGGITGTYIFKSRDGIKVDADGGSGTLNGAYTANPDGSGSLSLDFPALGFNTALAFALSDGGKTMNFIDSLDTAPSHAGVTVVLQGPLNGPFTGSLPIRSFLPAGSGSAPVTLSQTFSDGGGSYVYSSPPVSASGQLNCDDGSTPPFTLSLPTITAALNVRVNQGFGAGNFLISSLAGKCDGPDFEVYTGFANLTPNANGRFNLILHLTGFLTPGAAHWVGVVPAFLSGAYGGQSTGFPFPGGNVGVLKFDPAGTVAATFTNVNGPAPFAGTYTLNPDGTGSMTLKSTANAGASPITYAIVVADSGSTILSLRTFSNGAGNNLQTGAFRLQ